MNNLSIFMTIFAAAQVWVLPALIGMFFLSFFEFVSKSFNSSFSRDSKINWAFVWSLGILSIVVIGSLYWLLSFMNIAALGWREYAFTQKTFACAGVVALAFRGRQMFFRVKWNAIATAFGYASFILCVGYVSWMIFSWRTSFTLNWDAFEHQILVRQITQGNASWYTSELSDSFGFDAYPPIFHVLVALAQEQLPDDPASMILFWRMTELVSVFAWGIVATWLGWRVFNTHTGSLLAGFFSMTIFDSVLALTPFFLMPQTLTAWLLALALGSAFDAKSYVKPQYLQVFVTAGVLILMHYIIGSLAALLFVAVVVCISFKFIRNLLVKWQIALAILLLLLVGTAFSYWLDFSGINRGEAASYLFAFPEKMQHVRLIYGGLLCALVCGLFWVFQSKKIVLVANGYIVLAGIALLLANVPYVLKFLVLFRLPIILLIAYFFSFLLGKVRLRSKLLFVIYSAVLMFVTFIVLAFNIAAWKYWIGYEGSFDHINKSYIQAAVLLKANYPSNSTLLISDPSTQYVLEGLSGINSAGGFATDDYQVISTMLQAVTLLETTHLRSTAQTVRDNVVKEVPQKRLIAVSGRSEAWLAGSPEERQRFDYIIWKPLLLSLYAQEYTEQILKDPVLKTVYVDPYLVIFEI